MWQASSLPSQIAQAQVLTLTLGSLSPGNEPLDVAERVATGEISPGKTFIFMEDQGSLV